MPAKMGELWFLLSLNWVSRASSNLKVMTVLPYTIWAQAQAVCGLAESSPLFDAVRQPLTLVRSRARRLRAWRKEPSGKELLVHACALKSTLTTWALYSGSSSFTGLTTWRLLLDGFLDGTTMTSSWSQFWATSWRSLLLEMSRG